MKKVIPAILLLFFFVQVLVSQTVNERIQIIENNGSNFVFNLQVALDKDAAPVGNAVSRFLFNSNLITFPEQPVLDVDYSIHNFNNADYLSSISQPSEGTISVNIINRSGNALMLSDEFIDVATIRFRANCKILNNNDYELKGDLSQYFEPSSPLIWKVGSISISSLSKEYIPVPLMPLKNSVITSKDVLFKWKEVEGAGYYNLEISLDESFKQLLYSVNKISINQVSVKELSEGTQYYWRVRSVFEKEQSHFSKRLGFTLAIKEPSDLNSSSPDNDQYVELNWQNNSVSAQYIVIDRKESGSQYYTSIDTIHANRTSYIDPSIESEKGYVYRVSAINENTTSTYSDSTSIIMSLKKSEVENDLPKDFRLMQNYPNPFNPQTTINYSVKESSNITITIYSLLGEKITSLVDKAQNAGNYDIIWNASNYPSGIYIYVMSAESNISNNAFQNVKKMIVLK